MTSASALAWERWDETPPGWAASQSLTSVMICRTSSAGQTPVRFIRAIPGQATNKPDVVGASRLGIPADIKGVIVPLVNGAIARLAVCHAQAKCQPDKGPLDGDLFNNQFRGPVTVDAARVCAASLFPVVGINGQAMDTHSAHGLFFCALNDDAIDDLPVAGFIRKLDRRSRAIQFDIVGRDKQRCANDVGLGCCRQQDSSTGFCHFFNCPLDCRRII